MATRGYVFCIANDATPNFFTIGATRRDTACRLREANSDKWSLPFFRIVAQVESTDAFATKRAIHALLAHRRTCNRRNIFTLTEDEARALFDSVAMGTGLNFLAPRDRARRGRIGHCGFIGGQPLPFFLKEMKENKIKCFRRHKVLLPFQEKQCRSLHGKI